MTIFGEYQPPTSATLDDERDFFDVKAEFANGVSTVINGNIRFEITSDQARLLALQLLQKADESDYISRMEKVSF